MSRSRRKTPISGITTAESDHPWKKMAARTLRRRVKQHPNATLDGDRAEQRLSKRFAVYNMRRLVSPPPQSRPLAICDPNSVAISDLMPGMTHWGPPDEEVYHQNSLFRYNPAHRWYHYPDLTSGRIIVWAGFDADPRLPSIVPHAAFDNPDCADPAAYRTAVHGRAYLFFDA